MKLDPFSRIHSLAFLVLVLGLLLSLAAVPGVTLGTLPDGFRWRKDLIRLFTSFRFGLGDHLFNDTVAGKDGWLYYSAGTSFREYQRTDRFGQADLKQLQGDLDRINSTLAGQGRTLLLVVAPNKTSIYPQYMPDEIPVLGTMTRTDQFMGYLRARSTTRVLDLRPALMSQSATRQVYYRTDTHWNDLGAYYAYHEILSVLALDDPALKPRPLSDYNSQLLQAGGQTDLPRLMGYLSIPEVDPLLEPRFPVSTTTVTTILPDGSTLRLTTNQRTDLPRLLVFGDSFYAGLEKFLKPEFSQVVDLPYYDAAGDSLGRWVQLENPDIVLIECVERDLQNLFPLLHSIQP